MDGFLNEAKEFAQKQGIDTNNLDVNSLASQFGGGNQQQGGQQNQQQDQQQGQQENQQQNQQQPTAQKSSGGFMSGLTQYVESNL
jgi:hypothetical protein